MKENNKLHWNFWDYCWIKIIHRNTVIDNYNSVKNMLQIVQKPYQKLPAQSIHQKPWPVTAD